MPSEIVGPVEDVLPVDLRIPGCPPTPDAIAAALIGLIDGRAGDVSTPAGPRRRHTHVWFAAYTIIVLAVFVLSIMRQQWSVAVTALLIALVFGSRRVGSGEDAESARLARGGCRYEWFAFSFASR